MILELECYTVVELKHILKARKRGHITLFSSFKKMFFHSFYSILGKTKTAMQVKKCQGSSHRGAVVNEFD